MRNLILVSVAGCMLAGSAQATVIFTDRAAFDAAVAGSTTRTFPSATGFTDAPITLNSVTFSAAGASGSRAVTQDGAFSNAIYLAQLGGTATISSTMNALGLYIGSWDGKGSFGYTVGGTTGTFTTPNERASAFIGFLDTVPLSATFTLSNFQEFDITSFATQNAAPVTPPMVSPVAAVPEPATWAMMIGGFGMIGATMRRRKTAVATSAHFA